MGQESGSRSGSVRIRVLPSQSLCSTATGGCPRVGVTVYQRQLCVFSAPDHVSCFPVRTSPSKRDSAPAFGLIFQLAFCSWDCCEIPPKRRSRQECSGLGGIRTLCLGIKSPTPVPHRPRARQLTERTQPTYSLRIISHRYSTGSEIPEHEYTHSGVHQGRRVHPSARYRGYCRRFRLR